MSNGTLNQPIRTTHPTPPTVGRHLRYVYDNGVTKIPYYMTNDGIPQPVIPVANHADLNDIGSNTHAQIDSHISNTNNPHNTSYNDLQNLPEFFRWVLQAGQSNLPASGTESGFSYGQNNANDGVTAMANGFIEGLSVRIEPNWTAGTAFYFVSINNVNNNTAGRRVLINGSLNGEGGINGNSGTLTFVTPIPYNKGDQIEVRAITSGWAPTSSDSTVLLRMKENLI